ncbi:hypothetical protein O181_021080 [Austropuccinia psidii MF-1]|uniref:Uncharacterized protein n=1 Tax=Austropuccinia psidii MF-1 TaxID=1389203 RepID=A0A9Q3CF14_9BASI|nr:hypothetical protein [Austropuccinia psidii MF-1]
MKRQLQGHVLDNPYKEDIKPDVLLDNKPRSPSQYQDGNKLTSSKKGALKQLPDASSWPKFSGVGEYDHMELNDYIDRLFIDLPSIPDYWITAILSTAFKGDASIWVEIKDKPKARVEELTKNKPPCHNFGSTDDYSNNSSKGKKKVYAIEQVPEEEYPTEDSESDAMGYAIREHSDDDQDPREEFLVKYQEAKQLENEDIKLKAGMPQYSANKDL